MKSFLLYLTFFAVSLYIVSCGDDNTTNNNNGGGGNNDSLIYSVDTFYLQCSPMNEISRTLNIIFNDSLMVQNGKLTFFVNTDVIGNPTTGSIIISNSNFSDTLTTSELPDNHTFNIPFNLLNYLDIKVSIDNNPGSFNRFINLRDIHLYKVN